MDREKNTDGTSAAPETTDGEMPGRIFSGDAARTGGNAAGEEFEELFARLARSEFRSRFRLGPAEAAYAERKGAETLRRHAEDFVRTRLAPAVIPNDGRQTPMRGHPVFIAQHATAGRELSAAEQRYVVAVLMAWIGRQPLRQAGTNRPVR